MQCAFIGVLNQSLREAVPSTSVDFAVDKRDLFKCDCRFRSEAVKLKDLIEKAIIDGGKERGIEKLFTVRGKERLQNGDKRFPCLSHSK